MKDKGTVPLYAGIVLIPVSLMIIFFIVPKRVWVEVTDESGTTEVYIGGRADKFRSLYEEEYYNLINKIEARLSNGTD